MKIISELEITGVLELQLFHNQDERGNFYKSWHFPTLAELGIEFVVKECFWSFSKKGCIRGMHFQIPPYTQKKLICCQQGLILDVLLDLRKGSNTHGKSIGLELSGKKATAVYVPEGIAHGFQSIEEQSQVLYLTSHVHKQNSDYGVHWNSFGFQWPLSPTKISERDQNHPLFSELGSFF